MGSPEARVGFPSRPSSKQCWRPGGLSIAQRFAFSKVWFLLCILLILKG